MGWAEHRIEQYRKGQRATWLERRMLEHANPVHVGLTLLAFAGVIHGLWTHNWYWIVNSAALSLLGHIYCWTGRAWAEAGGMRSRKTMHP